MTTTKKAAKKTETTEQRWTKYAANLLVGRVIKRVRYMSRDECDAMDWVARPLVLELDDGTLLYTASDDEGNNSGTLMGQTPTDDLIFPVI